MKLGVKIDCPTGKRQAGRHIKRQHARNIRHADRAALRPINVHFDEDVAFASDVIHTFLPHNRFHGWLS